MFKLLLSMFLFTSLPIFAQSYLLIEEMVDQKNPPENVIEVKDQKKLASYLGLQIDGGFAGPGLFNVDAGAKFKINNNERVQVMLALGYANVPDDYNLEHKVIHGFVSRAELSIFPLDENNDWDLVHITGRYYRVYAVDAADFNVVQLGIGTNTARNSESGFYVEGGIQVLPGIDKKYTIWSLGGYLKMGVFIDTKKKKSLMNEKY